MGKSHTIFPGGMFMSYRIHYGPGGPESGNTTSRLRWFLSGTLLLICGMGALLSAGFADSTRALFCHDPQTKTEQAVAALANAIAAGEGWYHGLAVWCNAILFGPV